jgi:hypothetical protein
MPLFDDIVRTDSRLGSRTESQFRFLNRVDRPEFAAVRQLVEAWFDSFPPEARADLRERFRSDDLGQSLGAFWELYLHEIHRQLGYVLERDPEVPGTTKRPDFLAKRGDTAFYLEGTLVGYSDPEMADRRRQDGVLELVDEAFNADFSLSVQIKVAGRTAPARSEIVPRIEAWLSSLARTSATRADASSDQRPEFELRARDWFLNLRANPKPEAKRGDPTFPTVWTVRRPRGGAVDERRQIEMDLRDKASRYGRPDLPYVVAAVCLRDLAQERDIEGALYGPEVLRVPIRRGVGDVGDARIDRTPRGLWQWGEDQRATRVSAVLTDIHINPWLVARSNLTLWKNPWAAKPLTADLPWRTVRGDLEQNRLVVEEGTRLPRDVLWLAETWPYPSS